MAREKTIKPVEHFKVVDGNKIVMEEKDINNLSDAENTKIAFYVKTLGFDLVFIEPEPTKKNYFTVAKAEKYLAKDKEGLKKFQSFKKSAEKITEDYKALKKAEKEGGEKAPDEAAVKEARKAMISAQKDAFIAQKKWFKETYGVDEYDKVRKEY